MSNKKPLLEKVEITAIGSEGKALGRVGDRVVFVPMLIPGDVVDVQVTRKRKKYMEGFVVKFHHYSEIRIKAECRHFGTCGGCKWQHLPYDKQLEFKLQQVIDNFSRIGKFDFPVPDTILASERKFYYRNKLENTFSDRRWLTREEIDSGEEIGDTSALGFHIPGMFDRVLDIEHCHLQDNDSNAIRNSIREYARRNNLEFFNIKEQKGFLRTLIIRTSSTGELMVIVTFFRESKRQREALMEHIASSFPGITSLMYVINPGGNDTIAGCEVKLFAGRDHIFEEMEGLRFRVGPKSFYQTNTHQACQLYRVARDLAGLNGDETVYDLYTGTGTIASFVARDSGRVVGIEYVEEAIKDARINSELNNIINCRFYAGDIKDVLTGDFIESNGMPDVIITDPPRAGMHEKVVRKIMELNPQKIVYISCNPATQARDISILAEKYSVAAVRPVDMFPHTHHVECVVLLEAKRHRAQGTGHRARSTEHGAQGTGHRAQGTEHRAQGLRDSETKGQRDRD